MRRSRGTFAVCTDGMCPTGGGGGGRVARGRTAEDGEPAAQEPLDLREHRALAGVAERDGLARRAGAPGAADAMDVILRGLRQLEVEDVRDAVDVDAAGRDVGRDQHARGAAPERFERPLARPLRLVAVDRDGLDVDLRELLREPVGAVLRVA